MADTTANRGYHYPLQKDNPLEARRYLDEIDADIGGGGSVFYSSSYADLNTAITAIGSSVATLIVSTASFPDGANCTAPSTLALRFIGAGTLNQTHTVTINGSVIAAPRQVFIGTGSIIFNSVKTGNVFAAWWGEKTVTVSGPASAPTLTQDSGSSAGSFTDTTTYQVAYSYVAWGGETGISPVSSFTAKNGQGLVVLPIASLANNSKYAVGAYIYISADGGTTWKRANALGGTLVPALVSFGDDHANWGGAIVQYNASGAAPPTAGTTTTTKGGLTVPVPTSAPTITNLRANAAATVYGAFAYLCDDGTETALSPVSSSLSLSAGRGVFLQINEEPPSGAVAVRVYLGTSSTPANLHLQFTQPLHYVTGEIHDYNSSGAAPSAGAAQTAICNLQQAYDAVINSGSAGKVLTLGGTSSKAPLILRLKNSSGASVPGMQIDGYGGHAGVFGTASGRFSYTGTQSTKVVGVLACTTSIEWKGLDVKDPNSRLSVGLAACDFFGSGGFTNNWHSSTFEGEAAGGIGYQISVRSASSGAHTTSEQHFNNCNLSGKAWGVDLHGNQTGNIYFNGCQFYSGGDSNSANSGLIRNASAFLVHCYDLEGPTSAAGYAFFLTADLSHRYNAVYTSMTLEHCFTDAGSALASFVHVSAYHVNTGTVGISHSSFNSNLSDRIALYLAGPVSVVITNTSAGGNSWINWINTSPSAGEYPSIIQLGQDKFFGLGATYGFKSTNNISYALPHLQLFTSALEIRDEAGHSSLIETNASGDLILAPYSGKAALATDDAYDATTWNGNLGLPTKNAVRDKIESLGASGNSARAYNSGNLSIADVTYTALTLDSERWDNDTIHSTSSNTSRLTATTAGLYEIGGSATFAAGGGNIRLIGIRLNGTIFIDLIESPPLAGGGNVTALSIGALYSLAANDYVELVVYQDSGGALNVNAAGNYSPEFWMVRIGPQP